MGHVGRNRGGWAFVRNVTWLDLLVPGSLEFAAMSNEEGATGRRRRHASARRGGSARWALVVGGGAVGLGLLVAVVAGAFHTGETGAPPEGDDGRPGLPSLIQADPSGEAEPGDEGEATGAPRPSAPAGTGATTTPAHPSAATPSGALTGSPAVTPDGSGAGSDAASDEESGKPGKSGSAPGASKRPR